MHRCLADLITNSHAGSHCYISSLTCCTGSTTHTCCSLTVREVGGSSSWIQQLGSLSLRRSSVWRLSSPAFPKCNRDWMNCVRSWVRTLCWRQMRPVMGNERQEARVTAHAHCMPDISNSISQHHYPIIPCIFIHYFKLTMNGRKKFQWARVLTPSLKPPAVLCKSQSSEIILVKLFVDIF